MTSTRRGLFAIVAVLAVSCGGPDVRGTIDQLGGEACVPGRKVCLVVPAEALSAPIQVRISTLTDPPPAAVGESWEITAVGKPDLVFQKPATVMFAITDDMEKAVPSVNLLRIYSRDDAGEWDGLTHAVVDRVKNELTGETLRLGDFTALRTDRLPDGGLPVEGDGGVKDGGSVIIIPPPVDAGRPDSGTPDAGKPDAGTPDAGTPDAGPTDAGSPTDAGTPTDAGSPVDSGTPFDAGTPDAGGPADAGAPDAGPADAGAFDAGLPDAGDPDAGAPDSGAPDAGDAG